MLENKFTRPAQEGTLSANDGSTLSANDESTLSANDGSTLSANDGSTLSANDGFTLSAHDGSTLSANDGPTISANDGFTLSAHDGSTLSANDGFTLSAHDGTFFRHKDSFGVYFERILEHPVERVWAALTQPEHLGHWLAPANIQGGVGGSISLRLTGGVMGGRIVGWKENVLLEYVWHNGSTVRWELSSEGEGWTRLVFTHTHVADRQLMDAAKGWHYHLDLLALELDGKEMPHNPVESWDDITRAATVRYNAAMALIPQAVAH